MNSKAIRRRDLLKSAVASAMGFGILNFFSRTGLSQETRNNQNSDLNGVFIEAGSFEEFGGWILVERSVYNISYSF